MDNKNLLARHPATWIPTTWLAMGLPFVALAAASGIMYKNMGISDAKIAFWTSLVMLPWTLKPLWGPLLEMFKTKKFFVYTTQIFTGCLFGLVALSLQLPSFFAVSIAVLFLIAISGATHDMAADGVYLNELSTTDQSKYVGWQGAFYNIAKVLSGGVLVYMAGELEKKFGIANAWMIVMATYGGIMIVLGIYNMKVLPTGGETKSVGSVKEGFETLKDVMLTFFQKKNIALSLCFIVLYRFAEGQAIKITPLFFKAARAEGGLGLSTSQIGILYGVFGAIAFVLGSIAAGYYTAKKGLTKKTLLVLCAFFNIPFGFSIQNQISLTELEVHLDLVAVSIASDIVPINGENRILSYFGLKKLSESPCNGLKSIIKIAGIENKEITIDDTVFNISIKVV